MRDPYADSVRAFHEAFGHPVKQPIDIKTLLLRISLMMEEMKEIEEISTDIMAELMGGLPIDPAKLAHFMKELSDLQYVLSGTGVAFGLPLREAFKRVHDSNMSKLGADGKPVYREDGKILKGPRYKEPDLYDLACGVTHA